MFGENVACVDATALRDQLKSWAAEKLLHSENSDATTAWLGNVVKLVAPLLVVPLLSNAGASIPLYTIKADMHTHKTHTHTECQAEWHELISYWKAN